jgi:hypothetical protein
MNFSLLSSLTLFLLLFTAVKGEDLECGGGPPTNTTLKFFGSIVTVNTLHEVGGELRYKNIGTFKGAELDLVVTVLGGARNYTDIARIWKARTDNGEKDKGKHKNGYFGNRQFGNINLQYELGDPESGIGKFNFAIVRTGTNIPVVLESFSWVVWDLDERGNDNGNPVQPSIKERLSFDTSLAYNYSVFPNFADSWVKPICANGDQVNCTDGACTGVSPGHTSCPANTETVFRSSHRGGPADNPSDPNNLDHPQEQIRKQAVYFLFQNTSSFQFTFQVYCPINNTPDAYQEELAGTYESRLASQCKVNPNNPEYAGGNFMFSGQSDSIFYKPNCPTSAPTHPPTPAPTPSPTEVGACNMNRTGSSFGQVKFCVRSSYGYKYGPANEKYKEVNFIESLIKINYYLNAGFSTFCIQAFNVEPKERVETTANEDQYGLQAWLCDVNLDEVDSIDRTLPKRVTNYLTDGGTDFYNQGALITVCVSPDDESYKDGIRMSSLTDFKWNRNSFEGMGSLEVDQTAIEYSAPAANFLTYYDDSACSGAEWCSFSSVLFADFYMSRGNVTGSGNAKLEFGERRLTERRMLQEGGDSSKFDLSVGLNGIGDGRASLKTAGAVSSRFSVLPGIFVLLSAAAILV